MCTWLAQLRMKVFGGSQAVTYTVEVVPLPSSRHHLSYGDCLEDKREKLSELFCAILWATVVHNDMHTWCVSCKQFLKMSFGLGLVFMVALCNRADHYIFILFLSSFFFFLFFSSPNLSGRRLDVYHTRLAANTGRKKSPSRHHRTTLSGHIFTTKACIDNRKKTC